MTGTATRGVRRPLWLLLHGERRGRFKWITLRKGVGHKDQSSPLRVVILRERVLTDRATV